MNIKNAPKKTLSIVLFFCGCAFLSNFNNVWQKANIFNIEFNTITGTVVVVVISLLLFYVAAYFDGYKW